MRGGGVSRAVWASVSGGETRRGEGSGGGGGGGGGGEMAVVAAIERLEYRLIDYESLERAVGHNWYELDPDCRALVRGGCAPDDVEWADAKLSDLGALVGARVAPNADIVDAHPPQLVRYDRWANEVDEIVHHPAMLDSKRAMWESGYVSGFAADTATRAHDARRGDRGGALPRLAG